MRLVTTNSPMVNLGSTANHFSVLHWGGSDLGWSEITLGVKCLGVAFCRIIWGIKFVNRRFLFLEKILNQNCGCCKPCTMGNPGGSEGLIE